MGRILNIAYGSPTGRVLHDEASGYDVPEVAGPSAQVTSNGVMIADFRDKADALWFLSAIALQENNPEERPPEHRRRVLQLIPYEMAGRWYIIDDTPDRNAVGIFLDRDDADLFVKFMGLP